MTVRTCMRQVHGISWSISSSRSRREPFAMNSSTMNRVSSSNSPVPRNLTRLGCRLHRGAGFGEESITPAQSTPSVGQAPKSARYRRVT